MATQSHPIIHGTIGLVGPCGAGKSTLQQKLKSYGYSVRHIAQEHSFVPDMWRRFTNPVLLIYLNASYETVMKRKHFDFSIQEYQQENQRLQHAREHADFIIETDTLTPDEVLQKVIDFFMSVSPPP